ncbi:CU044_5270 family protein [Streptomyces sp. NPDC006296]|uniref:CU044_5270 family protein n=1 Tax=Streptomyces sp. NPDC006296 TaxID=3156746 RepID=UPI0033B65633
MKDKAPGSPRTGDLEELARILPAPAESYLPPDRRRHHRERLLNLVDSERTGQAGRTGRAGRVATSRRRASRFVVPAAALALACAVAVAITLPGPGEENRSAPGDTVTHLRPAAALLDRISTAAERRSTPVVRDDQFVYTRQKVRGADLTSGTAVLGPVQDYEKWLSQKPGPVLKQGLVRVDGETSSLNAELGDDDGTPAGASRPTYRWLSSLPTDPDDLLTYLYAATPPAEERERDQAVFEEIGSLLGGVMPPETAAALYRAAARIPGVTDVPRIEDAIGRAGVGIVREDTRYGIRTVWVFDRDGFAFLGSSSTLTARTSYGEPGTLLSSSAEIGHGVVDEAGRRPAGADATGPGREG